MSLRAFDPRQAVIYQLREECSERVSANNDCHCNTLFYSDLGDDRRHDKNPVKGVYVRFQTKWSHP